MEAFTRLDLAALAWFAGAWIVYALAVEGSHYGDRGLNQLMHSYRETWIRRMLERDMRMVDMQIMAALQNGAAFFASTSLLAVGGALTLFRSTEEALTVLATLPLGVETSRILWDLKVVGLAVILVYAFFKFAWSYGCSPMWRSCSARRRMRPTRTRPRLPPMSSARRGCSPPLAAISTAASVPSSSP
jgi:uncharacterized membrane protein